MKETSVEVFINGQWIDISGDVKNVSVTDATSPSSEEEIRQVEHAWSQFRRRASEIRRLLEALFLN